MSDYWGRSEYEDIDRDGMREARWYGMPEDGPDADELEEAPVASGAGWTGETFTGNFGPAPF